MFCNADKTVLQVFNQDTPVTVKVKSGDTLKEVTNFKYLGAWTASSEGDFIARKAMAWSACHRLRILWSSTLSREIRIRLFVSTVE